MKRVARPARFGFGSVSRVESDAEERGRDPLDRVRATADSIGAATRALRKLQAQCERAFQPVQARVYGADAERLERLLAWLGGRVR